VRISRIFILEERSMPAVSLGFFRRIRPQGVAALIAAPAALLMITGRAEVILTCNIFDAGSNKVTLQTSGSLTLPTTLSTPAILPLRR
jgi:hypothetical protein